MSQDDGFPSAINVILKSWPGAKAQPRPPPKPSKNKWPEWLTDPPPSLISRETALPVPTYSRLFHESFWARGGPYYQYGHQALRLPTDRWGGRSLKSHFEFYYVRKRDVLAVLRSRAAYRWMICAKVLLDEARLHAISEYMLALTEGLVEANRMGRRLHYDKKTWPRTDGEIAGHVQQIRLLAAQAPNFLVDYRQAQGGGLNPNGDPVTAEAALIAYVDQGRQIITEATEVQRLVSIEIQQTQFLVLGFLKQPDKTRRNLTRYMNIIRFRLQSVLHPMADEALQAAATAHQQYLNEIVPDLAQQVDDNQGHADRNARTSAFETMAATIQQSLPSTIYQLTDLSNTISTCTAQNDDGDLETPPLASFNYLADGAGLRELRTRQRDLRQLALRDMVGLPRGGIAHRVVTAWLGALRTQEQLAGLATQAERDALRRDLVADLMGLQF